MIQPTSGTSVLDYYDAITSGNSTHVKLEFENGGGTLTDDDISADGGVTISSVANSDEDLTYGKAVSTEVRVVCINNDNVESINWEETFSLSFGVEIEGDTDWVCVGYFRGKKPIKSRYSNTPHYIEFVAYDMMQDLEVLADEYLETVQFPATVSDICNIFQSVGNGFTLQSGDEISELMSVSFDQNPFPNGLTCREVLAQIAGANACFARMYTGSRDKIQFVSYGNSATTMYGLPAMNEDSVFNINVSDINVEKVDTIVVADAQSNTSYMYPTGGGSYDTYTIVNNYILTYLPENDRSTVLSKIQRKLRRVTSVDVMINPSEPYVPATVQCIGNWLAEAGDVAHVDVLISESQTVRFHIFIFSRTLQWNGSCVDTYECTGKTKRTVLTESAKEQYEQGAQYRVFKNDINTLHSEIGDRTGKTTTITQDISNINLSVEKKARVYYASSAPTGTTADPLVTGDLWIDTAHSNQLKRWNGSSWADASFDDPDKYTVRSGIDINANGIEITGSKYLKLISGGVLDVQATNFTINSTNKKMVCGNWTFDNYGMKWEDTTVASGNLTKFSIYRSSNDVYLTVNQQGYGNTYGFYINKSGNILPIANSGVIANTIGASASRWYALYANTIDGAKFQGDGVANNLTTTNAGYVLDARQGKALNDAVVHKTGEETITGAKTFSGAIYARSSLQATNSTTSPNIGFRVRDSESTSGIIYLINAGGDNDTYGQSQFYFRQYSPAVGQQSLTTHYEAFSLPPVDIGRTTDAGYRILTAKETVTVAQGGTGATTSAGALSNLGGFPKPTAISIPANSTKIFTVANNSRLLFVCMAGGVNYHAIFSVNVTSAGAVTATTYFPNSTSPVLMSTSTTNTFRISNGGTIAVSVYVFTIAGSAS